MVDANIGSLEALRVASWSAAIFPLRIRDHDSAD